MVNGCKLNPASWRTIVAHIHIRTADLLHPNCTAALCSCWPILIIIIYVTGSYKKSQESTGSYRILWNATKCYRKEANSFLQEDEWATGSCMMLQEGTGKYWAPRPKLGCPYFRHPPKSEKGCKCVKFLSYNIILMQLVHSNLKYQPVAHSGLF